MSRKGTIARYSPPAFERYRLDRNADISGDQIDPIDKMMARGRGIDIAEVEDWEE